MYSPILSKYGPAKCSKQILSLPVFDRSSISWIQALGRKNGWRHRYRFSCLGSWHWSLTVLLRRYFHESKSLRYERYEISCLMVHKKLWVSKTLFLYLNFKNWNKKHFCEKWWDSFIEKMLRFRLKKKSYIHVTIKPLSRFSLWLFDHVFDWLGVPLDHPRASWVYRL